jgi:hypothetical protein
MSACPSLSTSAITGYSIRVAVVLQRSAARAGRALVDAERCWSEYTTSALPSPSKSNTVLPVDADEQSGRLDPQDRLRPGTLGSMSFAPSEHA